MARSPLMNLVVRSLRALRVARGSASAAEEKILRAAENAERDKRSFSRRHFLQGAAATSALAACTPLAVCSPALSGCSDAAIPSSQSVMIVGGGIAGLHCAHRLAEFGVTATVYEASNGFGGRIASDRTTFAEGLHAELGGELIDTDHTTMRDLATEFGIELLDYSKDEPLEKIVAYIGGKRYAQADVLALLAPVLPKIDAALLVLKDPDSYISYKNDNGARGLDAMSLSVWLKSAGIGAEARALLETAYTIEYGLDPDACNAINFLTLIGTNLQAFSMFGASDERFHAKIGNDAFIQALVGKLAPASLKTGHALRALARQSDGRIRATFAAPTGTVEATADRIVLALPFSILRELDFTGLELPDIKQQAIRQIGYGANTKLMVGFSSRPWRTQGSDGGTYVDLGYQSTWDTTRLQPGTSGIITNFSGGAHALDVANGEAATHRDAFLAQFDKVYAGAAAATNGKVLRAAWPTNPHVKASYSAYLVGQYTSLAGAEGERVDNVHFAGEHTSRAAQGYMEGGAATGAVAAAEVIKAFGLQDRANGLSGIGQKMWRAANRTQADERG